MKFLQILFIAAVICLFYLFSASSTYLRNLLIVSPNAPNKIEVIFYSANDILSHILFMAELPLDESLDKAHLDEEKAEKLDRELTQHFSESEQKLMIEQLVGAETRMLTIIEKMTKILSVPIDTKVSDLENGKNWVQKMYFLAKDLRRLSVRGLLPVYNAISEAFESSGFNMQDGNIKLWQDAELELTEIKDKVEIINREAAQLRTNMRDILAKMQILTRHFLALHSERKANINDVKELEYEEFLHCEALGAIYVQLILELSGLQVKIDKMRKKAIFTPCCGQSVGNSTAQRIKLLQNFGGRHEYLDSFNTEQDHPYDIAIKEVREQKLKASRFVDRYSHPIEADLAECFNALVVRMRSALDHGLLPAIEKAENDSKKKLKVIAQNWLREALEKIKSLKKCTWNCV